MKVTAYKTPKIKVYDNLEKIILSSIDHMEERSVLAVTSKIVALSQGRVVMDKERDEIVPFEADYYLSREDSKYGFCLSIKNDTLIASAGIDHSNVEQGLVLWPEDIQDAANKIREILARKFNLKYVGVIITDSHVLPLRWGTHGTCLAYSGFLALNNYVGKPDIYGNPLQVSRANIAEGLAAATVLCMGEGNEQTPLAMVTDVDFVQFQDRNPSKEELDALKISIEDDIYAPLLTKANWKKGVKND